MYFKHFIQCLNIALLKYCCVCIYADIQPFNCEHQLPMTDPGEGAVSDSLMSYGSPHMKYCTYTRTTDMVLASLILW